jgi:hypothetical protein
MVKKIPTNHKEIVKKKIHQVAMFGHKKKH